MSFIIDQVNFMLIPLIAFGSEYLLQIMIILLIILIVLVTVLFRERRIIQSTLRQKVVESSAVEKLNATVIEQSPIGISVRDKNGKLLKYNQAWYSFWHITDENLTDYLEREREKLQFDDRDDYLRDWKQEVKKVYTKGGQLHIPEIKVIDNKQNEKWISHYFYSITDENGSVEKVVILTEDITKRKKYEIALSESEEKYRSLLENLPVGIYRTKPDGTYLSINKKMASMYGYESPEEMMEKDKLFDNMTKQDHDKIMSELHKTGKIDDVEVHMTKREMPVQWVLGSIKAVKDNTGSITYIEGIDIDITEKKYTELALQKEQQTLQQVIELNPYAICIFDRFGRYYQANKVFNDLFKAVPSADYSIFDDKIIDKLGVAEEFKNTIHQGDTYHFNDLEYNTNKLDPSLPDNPMILHIISFPIMNENNNLEFVIHMYENITEKKRIERELARERKTLNNIIDLNPYPITIATANGQYLRGNKAFLDLFKIPPPPDYNFYTDPIASEVYDMDTLKSKLAKGESISFPPMQYNTHDINPEFPDNPLTIEMMMFPLMNDNNEFEYVVNMFADVTERNKAIANLKESEEKFRTFAEKTSAAIFIHTDGRIKYVNPEALRLCGYTYEELKQMSLYDIFDPKYKEMVIQKGNTRMNGADVPSYETPILNKNGEEVWVIVTGGLIDYNGEKSILGTAFDISAKKKAEQELFRMQKERYSQIKEIAGGVAHEIYNSLFPAVSSIDKLKQRLAEKNIDEVERNLKLINLTDKAVTRAIHMTELVTEFSKLETQQEMNEINFANYVEAYINRFKYEHKVNDVKFIVDIDDRVVLNIHENHLYSLLYNIMSNAVDSFENDEKIIEVSAKRNGSYHKIILRNNGVPIPEDIREKIFDPFYSTKPKSGTGLGLAICKKIIEIYKGELTLQATIDKNTEFVILLPIEPLNH
ncbi:MAG: PAS domain S-box protein [Calditrichaeota bacterium]|nr:MAG: PAS domain S-box protein [Calditrichota bacterium]